MTSALITSPLAVARSFSPGHVTGVYDSPKVRPRDLLHAGSTGAGFSIDRGIKTTVEVYESSHKGYSISINGQNAPDAEVSRQVTERYLELADRPVFVSVYHDVEIPIGYGLGSSGAASLSVSYALNKALGTGLDGIEAAQIAHAVEIECKTGLGTVIAEFAGGFELRLAVGAPGIGVVVSRALDNYMAVILCISPVSTKKILMNSSSSLKGLGAEMVGSLSEKMLPEEFMQMSFSFAEKAGLTKGICHAPIQALARMGYIASVALFGETVFTLVPKKDVFEVLQTLSNFKGTLFACNIDGAGARLL